MNLNKKFDAAILRLEAKIDGVSGSLTGLEINGDGKKRNLEESLRYIVGLLADKIDRAKTRRKWEDRVFATAEWVMKTNFRRRIVSAALFIAIVYGVSSVLEDAGMIHQNAWKVTKELFLHSGI